MKFEDYRIAPEIKQNLADLGFIRPTDIQYRAIGSILKNEDVLAIAQTGTGKTAAFAIPILHLLKHGSGRKKEPGVKCLVMVPTRELALQITDVFNTIGKNTGIKAFALFGGVDQNPQISKLETGVDILITTPGRMFDLASQGHLILDRIKILVLDEADRMLDLGFLKDITDLSKRIPRSRQTLFFSATINDHIKKLAYSLVRNAIRIQISPKDPVSKNINHSVAFISMDDKRFFLERMIRENADNKILVFVRTKVRAERVLKALERVSIESLTIHGDKDQAARLSALKQFREGNVKVLIATDVSARGIDIPDVDFVVNYDLPDVAENYVHRVGRTGRGKKKGMAFSFCSPEEKPLHEEIEKFIQKPIEVLKINKQEYEETLDLTQDVSDKWKATLDEIAAAESWMKKKRNKK
ncbi:MAG: DEAD/DEAH box helicase [Saprospiraceae bacterium]|nr:DEAD/DEAH box helicase [Lewinellaceae bacterium]